MNLDELQADLQRLKGQLAALESIEKPTDEEQEEMMAVSTAIKQTEKDISELNKTADAVDDTQPQPNESWRINRLGVSLGLAWVLMCMLIAGLLVSAWFTYRANQTARAATREAQDAGELAANISGKFKEFWNFEQEECPITLTDAADQIQVLDSNLLDVQGELKQDKKILAKAAYPEATDLEINDLANTEKFTEVQTYVLQAGIRSLDSIDKVYSDLYTDIQANARSIKSVQTDLNTHKSRSRTELDKIMGRVRVIEEAAVAGVYGESEVDLLCNDKNNDFEDKALRTAFSSLAASTAAAESAATSAQAAQQAVHDQANAVTEAAMTAAGATVQQELNDIYGRLEHIERQRPLPWKRLGKK